MATIADLLIRVRADTGGAQKEISTFGSRVQGGFSKALLPAVAVLGVLGVAAKKASDDATALGESQNAVDVVFGKSSKTVSEFARVAGKEAGLSMRQLNELVTPIGALLKNFGFSAEAAAKGSVTLARRASDMASVFNTSVPEALGAIQAGLRGETEPLRRFGVGMDMAAVQAKALSMGLGKTTVDMGLVKDAQLRAAMAQEKYSAAVAKSGKDSDAAKVALLAMNGAQRGLSKTMAGGSTQLSNQALMQARLALVMEETKALQGDFVRTSDSAANAARINAAEQENLRAKLGTGVLPVVKMYQSLLAGVLGFLGSHTQATKIVVGVLVALAATVIIVNAALKVKTASIILAEAATKAWTVAQKLLNLALRANPIGLVVTALVLLGTTLVALYLKSERFRDIVNGAWYAVKNTTIAVWNAIGTFLKAWWPAILIVATGGVGLVVAVIVKKWDAIRSATKTVFDAIGGVISGAAGAVKSGADAIAGALQPALDVLQTLIDLAARAARTVERVAGAAGKIGGVVGKAGGVLGKIPGFAHGGRNLPGGLALVGERGPELVNLPRGSDVFSSGESRRMLGDGGPIIGEVHVHNPVDLEILTRRVERAVAFGAA